MRDNVEVPVAVVSSRHELDLAISTWVPGYLARHAPDVDTVIDLTSDGGLVLLDLADEDRTDWLGELRSRGFDGPLVVITPPDSRDHGALAGNVLVPGPLQVDLLQDAFDAALRRHRRRPHAEPSAPSSATPSSASTGPESAESSDPDAAAPRSSDEEVGATGNREGGRRQKPRRGLLRRRGGETSGRGPSPNEATGPDAAAPPAAVTLDDPASQEATDPASSNRAGNDDTIEQMPPPPPAPGRPAWETAPAPAYAPPGSTEMDEDRLEATETGKDAAEVDGCDEGPDTASRGPGAATSTDATTSTDGSTRADATTSTPAPTTPGPSTLTPEGALVVSDAAACAWLLLEDLDPIVRDGGAVVALRGADDRYATVAGIGIAPLEGAAQVRLDHPLLVDAGGGPALLHVPDTARSRLPLAGLPLADCPALLVMLVPGTEEGAALILLGRGDPFDRQEIDALGESVRDVPSLLQRIYRARHEAELRPSAVGAGAVPTARPGIFPGDDHGPARIVGDAASAAWRLIHEAYPLLDDASALVAFRGTGGWYTPVAATRVRALEGIRAVPSDHPLLGRIHAGEGSTLFIPRAEDAASTAGLPLGHEASIMAFAIGPADEPDALLMIGSTHIARASELEPFERLIQDGNHRWPGRLA